MFKPLESFNSRLDNQLKLSIGKMENYLRNWWVLTQNIKNPCQIRSYELKTNYSIKIAENNPSMGQG